VKIFSRKRKNGFKNSKKITFIRETSLARLRRSRKLRHFLREIRVLLSVWELNRLPHPRAKPPLPLLYQRWNYRWPNRWAARLDTGPIWHDPFRARPIRIDGLIGSCRTSPRAAVAAQAWHTGLPPVTGRAVSPSGSVNKERKLAKKIVVWGIRTQA
jgi:hypothetical protein